MSLPTVISESAESDLQSAFDWYEQQKAGLGHSFLLHVQQAFDRITEHPVSFPEVHRAARRALVDRFPYAIFYAVESTFVDVIAVMHTHRHARQWRNRVK